MGQAWIGVTKNGIGMMFYHLEGKRLVATMDSVQACELVDPKIRDKLHANDDTTDWSKVLQDGLDLT